MEDSRVAGFLELACASGLGLQRHETIGCTDPNNRDSFSQSGGHESEVKFHRATLPPKAPGTVPAPPSSSYWLPAIVGVSALWTHCSRLCLWVFCPSSFFSL